MDRAVRLVVMVGALVALAVGQERARDRGAVLGWVEDREGSKRAGAEVVLVSRTFPARVDVGVADVVRVVSDDDGRFRAECLRGRSYSAWASWVEDDGDVFFTRIAEGVVPGPVVGLDGARKHSDCRVVVNGLAPWREFGKVTAVAFCGSKNAFPVEVVLDADGKAKMPAMPGSRWQLEVRASNGQVLAVTSVRRQPETAVTIAAPRKVDVRVQDWDGEPVAGAAISYWPSYSAGGRHPRLVATAAATSDKAGRATVLLPAKHPLTQRNREQLLKVSAKGFAKSLLSVAEVKPGKEQEREFVLTLNAGHSITGVLRDARQQPLTGVEVFIECAIELDGKDSGYFGDPPVAVKTDASGRFAAHGLTTQAGCRVMLALSPEMARRVGFAALEDRALAPLQWIAAMDTVTQDVDLGVIALPDVPMCRLEVVDANMVPAADARVRLLHEGSFGSPIEFVTDRVGRLQFAFPTATTKVGVYVPGGGVALATVADAGTHAMRLLLMPTREVAGVVVDAKGKPAVGAQVMPWSRPQQMDFQLADLCYRSYRRSETTGEDGKFRVVLPLAEHPFSIRAVGTKDGPTSSELQVVDAETKQVELVLQSHSR